MLPYTVISLLATFLPIFLKMWLKTKKKQSVIEQNCYYQCVFIGYNNFSCKPHLLQGPECSSSCSFVQLRRLCHFVASAKESISLCMYMLTLPPIVEVIRNCMKNGVRVRMITDDMMSQTRAAQYALELLKDNGVVVKIPKTMMMHNKFCLIDETDIKLAKLVFGSMNWTAQGLCLNTENMIYTNNSDIIQRYSKEFEDIWQCL